MYHCMHRWCLFLSMNIISLWSYRHHNLFHSSSSIKFHNYEISFSLHPLYNSIRDNNNNKDDVLIPTNDFSQYLERKLRPSHVGIPRKRMDQQFAIQLMRNSYNMVDELNFVAMDEFQKDFFLFRSYSCVIVFDA